VRRRRRRQGARLLVARGANVNARASSIRDLQQEVLDRRQGVHLERAEDGEYDIVDEARLSRRHRLVHETPLLIALRARHVELATLLVCAGADTSARATITEDVWNGDGAQLTSSWSCLDLSEDDAELRSVLEDTAWRPEKHWYYGDDFKTEVRTWLLVADRRHWHLPDLARKVLFTKLAAFDRTMDRCHRTACQRRLSTVGGALRR